MEKEYLIKHVESKMFNSTKIMLEFVGSKYVKFAASAKCSALVALLNGNILMDGECFSISLFFVFGEWNGANL